MTRTNITCRLEHFDVVSINIFVCLLNDRPKYKPVFLDVFGVFELELKFSLNM